MNKAPYINTKNDVANLVKVLIIATIPLIIYGFFKNGIIPYSKDSNNVYELFKPILLPISGLAVGVYINVINNKRQKQALLPIYGLLAGCIMPMKTNLILFLVITFLVLFFINRIKNKITINQSALIYLIIIAISLILGNLTFKNNYEATTDIAYSFIDIIFGRSFSGISCSSIILSIISYTYLSFNPIYKKNIPISIISTVFALLLIQAFFISPFTATMMKGFSGYLFFASIFIAPDSNNTPYTKIGRSVYGIVIGILTFILSLFMSIRYGIFISILIASLFTKIFNNLNP